MGRHHQLASAALGILLLHYIITSSSYCFYSSNHKQQAVSSSAWCCFCLWLVDCRIEHLLFIHSTSNHKHRHRSPSTPTTPQVSSICRRWCLWLEDERAERSRGQLMLHDVVDGTSWSWCTNCLDEADCLVVSSAQRLDHAAPEVHCRRWSKITVFASATAGRTSTV